MMVFRCWLWSWFGSLKMIVVVILGCLVSVVLIFLGYMFNLDVIIMWFFWLVRNR